MKKGRSKTYRFLHILRVLSQLLIFFLFFKLLLDTRFPGGDYIGRVEIFFHFDPLLALGTFIASRLFFTAFFLSLITLGVSLLLGRVACGWLCPLGSLHQFFSFLFKKTGLLHPKRTKDNHVVWKYYLLLFLLLSAVFTLDLIGLFDPLSFLFRSFAASVIPALGYTFSVILGLLYNLNLISLGDSLFYFYQTLDINTVFQQGFLLGIIFVGIVLLNIKRERFWCRYLCPLGAFLGLAGRWGRLKLKINMDQCIKGGLCTIHCETQATPYPQEEWNISECVYCFTCASICPTAAITFPIKLTPQPSAPVNLSRRRMVTASLLGVLTVPFFRLTPVKQRASAKCIRPPGALPEEMFLKKCIKCGECLKVCPTNGLQPALTEAGPEGLWTPILVPRMGSCEYYCSLCTQVCPTGAIQELTVEEKVEVKIGTAWVDKNRCIPYKMGEPCIVCEEHCPISPKAIQLVEEDVRLPDGTIKREKAPFVDIESCTGCGICENKCPVVDAPAIYVTSVGESRSERNQVILDLIQNSSGPY